MISSLNMPLTVGVATDEALRQAMPAEAYRPGLRVAALIKQAMLAAGLGRLDPERPLADLVKPGMSVLIKPNWVLDRNLASGLEPEAAMTAMVTHPEFIYAALEQVLAARPARVTLADAPIQACHWPSLVTDEFQARLRAAARSVGADAQVVDLRRTIWNGGGDRVQSDVRERDRYLLFDLGADSLLEPISVPAGRFRVTNYDPRKLAETHRPGRHQYLLCREAFEADFVLSLPKLKLHRKAGITGALKNLVGLNGNKDYLPHHRRGGSRDGGDCYPGRSVSKRTVELLLDAANRRLGSAGYGFWHFWARQSLSRVSREEEGSLEGGWHGNDTCWRMVLDLNRILRYGRADGTLADAPQRTLWSLTDAIVCGEGEGPLSPSPLTLGAVTFSGAAPAADAVHAALMRLDPLRIPLVRESFGGFRWPLVEQGNQEEGGAVQARWRGDELPLAEVAARLGVAARPPLGWAGHIEWQRAPT